MNDSFAYLQAKLGWPLIFVVSFLLIGLFLLVLRALIVHRTKKWPVTSGKIIKSDVVFKIRRSASNAAPIKIYDLDIKYQYVINSQEFVGSRLRYFHSIGTYKKHLDKFTSQYPVGADVDVYFNSKKPEEALLIPGITKGILTPVLFFVIALISIGFVIMEKTM